YAEVVWSRAILGKALSYRPLHRWVWPAVAVVAAGLVPPSVYVASAETRPDDPTVRGPRGTSLSLLRGGDRFAMWRAIRHSTGSWRRCSTRSCRTWESGSGAWCAGRSPVRSALVGGPGSPSWQGCR